MNKEEVEGLRELVDRISFRLLATRKHPDQEWLYDEIKEYLEKIKSGKK